MKKTLLTLVTLTMFYGLSFSQTTFSTKKTINASTGDAPYAIDSGELSGDTYKDIVIGTNLGNTVEWYKNNGDGTFTLQTLVSSSVNGVSEVLIADLNNDGFNDILATSYTDDKLVWFANDGLGNFGSEQVISSSLDGAGAIATGTIDVGTTIDVAVAAYESGDTVWFSNNGSGVFTGPNTIAADPLSGPGYIDMADFDDDGDLDVVIANQDTGTVELYYNNLLPSGSGTVSYTKDAHSVATDKIYLFDVSFGDVNDDNNLDIIAVDLYGGASGLGWYKKEDAGTFTETIITTDIANPSSAAVADMDDDSYNDIVLSSGTSGAGNDIVWFKSDTSGGFAAQSVIDNTQSQAYAFTLDDFDNDGDIDIACVAYNQDALNWFENFKYTLSTPEISAQGISVYPNPTKNTLNFKGITESINVSVFDIIGKKVLNETLNPESPLDVSSLQSGVYLLKLDGHTTNFRFIKE